MRARLIWSDVRLFGAAGQCAAYGDAAEGQAFADVACPLIEVAPHGTEFACGVQACDGFAGDVEDFALCIADWAAIGVEHGGRALDSVERGFGDFGQRVG